jgi:hypothetical protein
MLIFLWPFGIFYAHFGYFMTIWYILCSFGPFFPALGIAHQKNLATLACRWTQTSLPSFLGRQLQPAAAVCREPFKDFRPSFGKQGCQICLITTKQNGEKCTK